MTAPPLANRHRIVPVAASSAYMLSPVPAFDPA
jgi:hypothetical protein